MHDTPTPVLGIDFGTRRIGVALLQHGLAEPLTILTRTSATQTERDPIYRKIQELTRDHQVVGVVVGISESTMAELTRAFVAELSAALSIWVVLFDETLSSQVVSQLPAGQRRRRRSEPIDDLAAAHILEEWVAAGCPR